MSNDSSSFYKDDDEQVGQTRKQKKFTDKILNFSQPSQKKQFITNLQGLIRNVDTLMNA